MVLLAAVMVTGKPCSTAVFAVIGPIQATTASPISFVISSRLSNSRRKFRTVEELVKVMT